MKVTYISSKHFQLTLALIKPHIVKSPFALQKIRDIIINNNFKVIRTKRKMISYEEAEQFYIEHKNKFFYNRLLTFMCSGPSDIHILGGDNVIIKWRQLLGPTKSYQAQFTAPESIRGLFGLSDTRNAAHGSDSEESTGREISILFPEFDVESWLRNEEPLFESNKVHLNTELFVHKINQ